MDGKGKMTEKTKITETCKCGHSKVYHDDTYGCVECKCMWFEPIEKKEVK